MLSENKRNLVIQCKRCGNSFETELVELFGKFQPSNEWCDPCWKIIQKMHTKGEEQSELRFREKWWKLNVPDDDFDPYTDSELPMPAGKWLKDFRATFAELFSDPPKGLIIRESTENPGKRLLLHLLRVAHFDQRVHCGYWRISDPSHKVHFYLDEVLKGAALVDHLSGRVLLAIEDLGGMRISKRLGRDLLEIIEKRHGNERATIVSTRFSSRELINRFEDRAVGIAVTRRLTMDCFFYQGDTCEGSRLEYGSSW
jgi:hypothetical protein